MASTLTGTSVFAPAATTLFTGLGGRGTATSTTESDVYWATRNAGTWDKLQTQVIGNLAATAVLRFRKNSANGNQLVSPGAATGYFEDTSNSDTVSAGDNLALNHTAGTTSAVTYQQISSSFTPAGADYVSRTGCGAASGLSFTTAATDFTQPWGDTLSTAQGDSVAKAVVENASVAKNLYSNVLTNARTTTTNLRLWKNNAAGNLIIPYTSGQTGIKEDTSNSDTLAAGDTIDGAVSTAAADSNSIVVVNLFIDLTSTSASVPYVTCNLGTINANLTRYYAVIGRGAGNITVEAQVQYKAEQAGTFEKSSIVISTNTVTATTNFRMRVNGNPGNNVRVIASSTTGTITDTSNTDAVVASDLVDVELTTGATGTSIAGRQMVVTFTATLPSTGHPTMRRWGGVPFLGGIGIGQKGPGRTWGQREKAA